MEADGEWRGARASEMFVLGEERVEDAQRTFEVAAHEIVSARLRLRNSCLFHQLKTRPTIFVLL